MFISAAKGSSNAYQDTFLNSSMEASSENVRATHQSVLADSPDPRNSDTNCNTSTGRVMIIDGTSIMYRSYYKLLGMPSLPPFLLFSWQSSVFIVLFFHYLL